MAGNGNKGKFSERLRNMRLIRYARMLRVVDNEDNKEVLKSSIKNKVISGASVGAAVIGAGISNVVGNSNEVNNSVDNKDFSVGSSKKNVNNRKSSLVDNKKVVDKSFYDTDNEKESTSDFIKRKSIEAASVGAAVIGAVSVNLLGGSSVSQSDKVSESNSSSKEGIGNDKSLDNISFGDNERKSFGRVFRSGEDVILIDKISDKDIVCGDRKTYLASQIIKKVKREFERKLNEIEVLESELYILQSKNENELDLERCKEIKKEIEEAIKKINHIIDQYNIYRGNRLLDDMLYIDDSSLVDDISDFKRLYEGAEIERRLVSDYHLIGEYQLLYDRLENIKSNVLDVSLKNENKVADFDIRDKKYDKIKDSLVKIDKVTLDCNNYIESQEKYLDDLMQKVSKIDVDKVSHYRLEGFGNLLSGSLRYLGLLMASPFVGLSSIAFSTYATNRMIFNLRRSLRLEKITSTVYKAEDYQFELNDKINTLDYNYDNIDKTLDNVLGLKSEFMEQYNYEIAGYDETLRKINEIENIIYNNKEKLNIIRDQLKKNRKLNSETLNKCRILQKNDRPYVERV
jgi:hypothetical protein